MGWARPVILSRKLKTKLIALRSIGGLYLPVLRPVLLEAYYSLILAFSSKTGAALISLVIFRVQVVFYFSDVQVVYDYLNSFLGIWKRQGIKGLNRI